MADGGISGSTGSTTVCKTPCTQASQYRATAFFVSGTKERKTGVPGGLRRVRVQLLDLVHRVATSNPTSGSVLKAESAGVSLSLFFSPSPSFL